MAPDGPTWSVIARIWERARSGGYLKAIIERDALAVRPSSAMDGHVIDFYHDAVRLVGKRPARLLKVFFHIGDHRVEVRTERREWTHREAEAPACVAELRITSER